MEVVSRAAGASRLHSRMRREPSPTRCRHEAPGWARLQDAARQAVRMSRAQWLSCSNSHNVCLRTYQKPGESTRGTDVICQTPRRPPGRNAGVCDDVAVNGVLNAMSGESTNNDPWASLEAGNGRDHEQRHDDGFEKHGLYRTDHCRKQHVIRRNHDQDGWIKCSIAIKSHLPGEHSNGDREDDTHNVWQHEQLLHLCVTTTCPKERWSGPHTQRHGWRGLRLVRRSHR